jgi:hypothetical protein
MAYKYKHCGKARNSWKNEFCRQQNVQKENHPPGRILLKGGFLYLYLVFFVAEAVGKLAVNSSVNTS